MRTPVFEFATARNPQTISPQIDQAFSIRLAPDLIAQSHYFSNMPRQAFKDMRAQMETRAAAFGAEVTLRGAKQDFAPQLAFHDGFQRRFGEDRIARLAAVFDASAPGPLSDADRLQLWDNIAHHLWVQQNEDIVEVIRAVLRADHFRSIAGPIFRNGVPTDDAQIEAVLQARRARVVLPLSADNRVGTDTPDELSFAQARLIRRAHKGFLGRQHLQTLVAFRSEFAAALTAARPDPTPQPDPSGTPARGFVGPNALTLAQPVAPVRVNALALARPMDLPIAIAARTPPEEDADAALIALDDDLATLEAELGDRDPEDEEDEQVFFLHGSEIVVTERIPPGAFMISAEAVAGGFHLYLTYFHEDVAPELGDISGRINLTVGGASVAAQAIAADQPGYQHFRLTSEPISDARYELTLDLAEIGSGAQRATLDGLVIRDVGDQSGVVPWVGPDSFAATPPPLFGVNKIGVLDFHRVEQELYCFEASEPSHIENLMGREHKERMTRHFTLNEVETERLREAGFERQADTSTTDRFEQQSTVEEVLQDENSRNINVNAGVSGGFGNSVQMFANTAVTFANSSSREQSTADALTFARDVTNKVSQKITSRTTERRRARVQREFEEVSRRGLDNRAGDQPVVSIFRFLDKVYRNTLVNYGRRCVVEWMIPEPAKNFIRAQDLAVPDDDFKRRPPKRPRRLGLRRPSDVTPANYRKFGKAYGIEDLPAPPPFVMYISRSFAENDPPAGPPEEGQEPFEPGPQAVAYDIEIPEDYLATHFEYSHESHAPQTGSGGGSAGMQKFDVPLSFSVPYQAVDNFPMVAKITLRLVIRKVVQRDWQYQIFTRVMEAYREKKAEYDAAKEAYENESREADLNPRFKADIIQRELRRIALYMIQKPHDTDVTHNHYAPAKKGKLHRLRLTRKLDRHSQVVRFFEQAFEWDLMAYLLYPYYYADEKTWSVKLALEETRNRDFAAFLTSGMARLVVPIRPGFEDAVTHYLQTGEVWFGRGLVMDVDNDLYLSIAEEMASGAQEREILDTWLTKVPTNLTIIQENAAAIVGDGLPCLDEEQEPLGTGNSILAPVVLAATPDNG